jgi:translation initiation factor IF-2
VATTRIISLRHYTEDRTEIPEGMECGVGLEDFSNFEIGDLIEAFQVVEVQRSVEEIREKTPELAAAQR